MRLLAAATALLVAPTFPVHAQCALWEIDAYSDPEAGAQFGLRVAIHDTWAAVGSVYDSTGSGFKSGSVRMLQEGGGHWAETQGLFPTPGGYEDWFGAALAMEDDLLVVGAPNDDDRALDAGAVYLYRLQSGVWVLEQKIVAGDGEDGDHFGSAVAIAGERIVIGAPEEDALGSQAGAAYLFAYDGTMWNEVTKLVATSFGGAGDSFGYSVDIKGGTILVGAPRADVGAGDSGAAYVMAKVFSTWLVQAELVHPLPKPEDRLGSAVVLDGEIAVAGAPGRSGPPGTAVNYGALFLFERSGTLWSYKDMIQTSGGEKDFGATCAVSEDWMIVGAPFADGASCCDHGSVYLFERVAFPPGWTEQQQYLPCDIGPTGDHVGASVAIHGDRALVGSPLHDIGAADSGSAYVIERQGSVWSEVRRATSNGGLSIAAGGAQQILLRAGPDDAGRIYFLGGTMSGTSPGVQLSAVTVPLNIDSYALYTLNNPNSPVLPNSFGFLDGAGAANCSFSLPPGVVSVGGLLLHHAFVVLDPVTLEVVSASAAEPLALSL